MKKVSYTEDVPLVEKKQRGPTFFTAIGSTENEADNKVKHLVKKYITDKGKTHQKKVEDV